MEIQCFWLEETMRAQRYLRRFASRMGDDLPSDDPCPAHGYHNVMVLIDEIPFTKVPASYGGFETRYYAGATDVERFSGDPRWPTTCDCGYVFREGDRWQIFTESVMRRTDTGQEVTLRDAPAGAMWDAWWYGDSTFCSFTGDDGLHLMVRCPGTRDGGGTADWYVDGRAGNAPQDRRGWTRTGDPRATPPTVTANPSIQITQANGYHGWLRSGKLVDA